MARPVIIGAGLAGLACALALAPRPVVLLGRKPSAGLTSSVLAQGGIAAAIGKDDDAERHILDTLAAGAGLCDESAVRSIIGAAPQAIEKLFSFGVAFDRDGEGNLKLGLEAAHSRRRIVHARGDSTGAVVMKALFAKVLATPSILFIENAEATRLVVSGGAVSGVLFRVGDAEELREIATDQIVLATGSACALWRKTTVPRFSWGHGLALAARAGAVLRDLEFVQFHPTALDVGVDPMPLLSEALRGEGARLVTEKGERFVDELGPRDVVAREIWREKQNSGKVFLDARHLNDFKSRFPTIAEMCFRAGVDPCNEPLPVCPVAHYHMGGVATDLAGRTSVAGLWACGEGACTGLHGANRLASNSLLEAFIMGTRVAENLEDTGGAVFFKESAETFAPASIEPDVPLRKLMCIRAGLERDSKGLEEAEAILAAHANGSEQAFVGLMIVKAAQRRAESRGAHYRSDYPEPDSASARPFYQSINGECHGFIPFAGTGHRAVGARCFA